MANSIGFSGKESEIRVEIVVYPNLDHADIPKEFYMEYGMNLGGYVVIKDPEGNSFHIGLAVFEGNASLFDGLDYFKTFYALSRKSYVDLLYIGNNKFDVRIFDYKRIEISYPKAGTYDIDFMDMIIPGWSVELTKYQASGKILHIPASFAKRVLDPEMKCCFLKDEEGVRFPCTLMWSGRRPNEVQIGSGWNKFCQLKRLKKGDVVNFTLDDQDASMINVQVIYK